MDGQNTDPKRMAPGHRRAALTALAAITTAFLVAACSQPASSPSPTRARQELAHALRAWSAFPVKASTRPIVLAGPPVNDPASGFPNGAAKLAYLAGAITVPATLPPGPARASGYPLISARAALRVLWSQGAKVPREGAPLTVTSVRLGTGVFTTDHGQVRLPAWLLRFRHVADPAQVLAVAPHTLFQAPPPLNGGPGVRGGAILARNGRTVTLRFVGAAAGTGPCTASYRAELAESSSVVAVVLHEQDHGTGACSAVGYRRQVTTVLPSALGGRVLVDAASDTAITVTRVG